MSVTRAAMGASIRIGELSVSGGVEPLQTLLGSCVGLALHCPQGRVGGLAHIMLPYSEGRTGAPAKFADAAVPELLRRISALGGSRDAVRAKIAGGANMFESTGVTIGAQNTSAIREILEEMNIRIVAEHSGGTQGRRMTFHPRSGKVTIEIVGGARVEI